jgi:hypothetical protein
MYEGVDLITDIRVKRLEWLGHVNGMDSNKITY